MSNKTNLAKQALSAHSWMGVFLGALLFWVCLSGTLVVFHQEMERWEQPAVLEMADTNAETVQKAFDNFTAKHKEDTEHFFVVFPTSGIPRLVVENDHVAYFADQQGNLLEKEQSPLTKMLVNWHLYLHLPMSWGMILVSALGAIICALVISGIIAHKRILKDAFRLRTGSTGQQYQIDLHNRFGVWAAPFHLIIGITGTYFGLAGVMIVIVAQLFYNGDRQAVMDTVFTPEPELHQTIEPVNVGKAFEQALTMEPNGKPIFMTVHEPGTEGQFIEIYTEIPGRMLYSENFRFDAAGNFISTGGYKKGAWGKQLVYSLYRLHFGQFAGMAGKVLYFVLGIMLTLLCTSGMKIWFNKRAADDALPRIWTALVWSTFIGVTAVSTYSLLAHTAPVVILWGVIAVAILLGWKVSVISLKHWQIATAVSLAVLLLVYAITHQHGLFNLASLQLNLPIVAFIAYCLYRIKRPQ
ncbi:PepSY-associated TM helix domain-containing protein [Neptunicella marina]|uniref:PepSY domain-containing protein n=1 Tax=Neptunicella marina TaxID=2125989 RepID=A0A8J6IRR9_9ALTE|nr:PepSY domain-containing protein [Neptunicella marina]MBC3765586.1 PepSY domain-containing protein [Neptunicella marina]